MSPTLLEGFIVVVLIIVAWQIGVQLAPEVFWGLKSANDQFEKNSSEIEKMMGTDEEKKQIEP